MTKHEGAGGGKITWRNNPIRLKSFLIVSAAAFVIYPTYLFFLSKVYLHYDGQWWFERIDWNLTLDPLQMFFQIFPWPIFIIIIPGVVGVYGGYHFLSLRKQILDHTDIAVSQRIMLGVAFLWAPWSVLGIFLLQPAITGVMNYHEPGLLAIQNFVFIPLASLITLNLPGLLSLYVFSLRKKYAQK